MLARAVPARAAVTSRAPTCPTSSSARRPATVSAKAGDDVVYGLGGADRIDGGAGDDEIHGDGVCADHAVVPDACDDRDDRSGGPTC